LLSAWTRMWSATRRDAVEVLSKPVDPQRLIALVRRICDAQADVSSPARATDRRRDWDRRRAWAAARA
jgi:DNA-binding NtrC family response regulator